MVGRTMLSIKRLIFAICLLAAIKAQSKIMTEPETCSSGLCAYHIKYKTEHIEGMPLTILASHGSSFKKESANKVHWIRGTGIIRSEGATIVHTMYGDMFATQGDFLIEANDQRVQITNLSSDMSYSPRGEKKQHQLPVSYQTDMSKVTKTGVALTGFPRPAAIEPLIKNWSQFYSQSEMSSFKWELRKFMGQWKRATESVGGWYRSTVEREIASLRAEEAHQEKLRQERDKENQVYRQMFRNRLNGDY